MSTPDPAVAVVRQYSDAIRHHRETMQAMIAGEPGIQVPPVILEMESKGGLNIPVLLSNARWAEMRDMYR